MNYIHRSNIWHAIVEGFGIEMGLKSLEKISHWVLFVAIVDTKVVEGGGAIEGGDVWGGFGEGGWGWG